MGPINLVGHDVGMMVAYAYAASFRSDVKRLAMMEAALPGLGLEELYDAARFARMYHLPLFEAPNALAEKLITGRERMFVEHFMLQQAYDTAGLDEEALQEYARWLSAPGALHGGISYFRSHWTDAEHNREHAKTELEMPVLTVAGSASAGADLAPHVGQVAGQLESVVIEDCGHYVAEERPERVIDELRRFFTQDLGSSRSPTPTDLGSSRSPTPTDAPFWRRVTHVVCAPPPSASAKKNAYLPTAGRRSEQMKIIATKFGDPQVLQAVPTENPPPGRGEVSIQVRAAGVNHRDYKVYNDPDYATRGGVDATSFPLDLVVEAAGVVSAVGEDAFGPAGPIEFGDEVIAYRITGAYADAIVVSASAVVPKPTKLSWAQAGSMMLAGTTAAHTLAAVRARPGQTLLVHAAAGGVGLSVVQLAGLDGIKVIGTASEGDFDILRGYGAIPVTYGDGLAERVAEAAPNGIDAAVDLIGTDEAIDVSLGFVADHSRIATIVAFDRAKETGIQALGGSEGQDRWGIAVRDNARLRLTALGQVGAYDIKVSDSFPLAEAAAAHQLLARGGADGLVVLLPEDRQPK